MHFLGIAGSDDLRTTFFFDSPHSSTLALSTTEILPFTYFYYDEDFSYFASAQNYARNAAAARIGSHYGPRSYNHHSQIQIRICARDECRASRQQVDGYGKVIGFKIKLNDASVRRFVDCVLFEIGPRFCFGRAIVFE
ncbi:hypothetical protein L218DRAFT_439238 [Marasmius fiardii PR-910]|nr:hypothetical protein L218DRAFT_439238 [Marasmius fiardii PR-910]